MKNDTKFGQLLDLAFKHRYGEDFEWKEAVVTKDDEGDYIVKIDTEMRHINPAIVCFQICKYHKTMTTEDGEMSYCDIEGECPIGKWEPVIKI